MYLKKGSLKLAALKFLDIGQFCKAISIATERGVPFDIPGQFTLIVRESYKYHFDALGFKEQKVATPFALSKEELAELRALRKTPSR